VDETALAGHAGAVRLYRRFSWPGRIDPHERVWLTVAGETAETEISLNGQTLIQSPEGGTSEWDVTSLIQPRNQLILNVPSLAAPGGRFGDVSLEVRCLAYLRGMSAEFVSLDGGKRLRVRGELAGVSGRPLELYTLLDDRNVQYATHQPLPAGQAFQQTSDVLPTESADDDRPHQVRVELVDAASVWYCWETTIR
jgi:hypothetical protein